MIKAIQELEKRPSRIKRKIWRELHAKFGEDLIIHTYEELKDAALYLANYGDVMGSDIIDKSLERFFPAERTIIFQIVKSSPDEQKKIRQKVRNQLLKVRNFVLKRMEDNKEQKGILQRIFA